ncbi:MAG: ATP-binding protein [Thermodesulfovibrionales bacterium]
MKIEQKIILSNVFNIGLVVFIGLFAFQNLNQILTKLRFVEIADDLNASFLEMRLSEKNFFLYKDTAALSDIKDKIDKTLQTIEDSRKDIVKAVGEENLSKLITYLRDYSNVINEARDKESRNTELELRLRAKGKKLKEFSEDITRLERSRVNEIISRSKKVLFYSFWVVFLCSVGVSHLISQNILRSLRKIEKLALSISEGNFRKIEGQIMNDELGAVIRAINFMSDELRYREDQIIQSKKLASIGILTAGIAHELINPVNNISMIAQTYSELYHRLGEEERVEFMRRIEGETERMKDIIRNLLDFSRPKEPVLRPADINRVIEKSLKLTQNTLNLSDIEVRLSLADGLPPVFIDENQIQQVFVNLITNAVQAMTEGGTLIISTAHEGRDSVKIIITDTGRGIPPEFLPHIFDPFFTTKEGGTGLGLSVSYAIIKKHNGTINVQSRLGAGTTFIIELPVYKEERVNVSGS